MKPCNSFVHLNLLLPFLLQENEVYESCLKHKLRRTDGQSARQPRRAESSGSVDAGIPQTPLAMTMLRLTFIATALLFFIVATESAPKTAAGEPKNHRSRITGRSVDKWVTAGGSGRARFVPEKKGSKVGQPGVTLGITKRWKGRGRGRHGRKLEVRTWRRDGMLEYRKVHSTNGSDVYENNPEEVCYVCFCFLVFSSFAFKCIP